ncbi:hypothetical protein ACROYT_G020381 [Oculina patagonica]
MKTFAALLLLGAVAAYVSANDIIFCKAVINFIDQRHDERMSEILRSQGLPEDTLVASDHPEPPDFIKPCIAQGKICWKQAGHDSCKKLDCTDNFFKCVIANHPTPLPTFSPIQKGCVALLHLCRQKSTSCAGKLCCFVRIKKCFTLAESDNA